MEKNSYSENLSVSSIDTWIFDLDNTLYPSTSHLFDQISERIGIFVSNYLSIPLDDARVLQKQYFFDHGTTLRGLMLENSVDPYEFLDFVHDIDFSPLQPDSRLIEALEKIEGQRLIFTNADAAYAKKVTNQLGIDKFFPNIFDIIDAEFIPKPYQKPYDLIIKKYNLDPNKSIFFEDILRNLGPAKQMGMKAVWIKNNGDWALPDSEGVTADHETNNLPEWINSLFI